MSELKVNAITNAAGGNTATINGMTPTADSLQGFRNRILNGGMVIDQRNAGASVTPANGVNTFITDRWSVAVNQSSKLTSQQSTVAPSGFTNSLLVTSSSAYSITSTDLFAVTQKIEGFNCADFAWGTANAQAVTVSFKVRSSLTGTFGGVIRNSASNRFYPFSYTISSANTFEDKTVTIPGDTTGTWLTNNGTGLELIFGLGVGTSYSQAAGAWTSSFALSATGAVSLVGTSGATFYITGVQLEAGSVATPFERRPYGTELALCQRYYQFWRFITRFASTNSNHLAGTTLAVPMRASPTITRTGDAWTSSEGGTSVSGAINGSLVIVVGNNTSDIAVGGFGNANAEL